MKKFHINSKYTLQNLRTAFTMLIFTIMISTTIVLGLFWFLFIGLGLSEPTPDLIQFILLTLLISNVLGTCIACLVGKRAVSPFRVIINATQEISRGNFSVRIKNDSSGEIGNLMDNFNTMAAELGHMELLKNDFINNFSHEFRTPIVSIRGFAKLLKKKDLPDDLREEYTDIIIKEAERLTQLSSHILLLSSLENQDIITEQTEFSLDEQLRSVILLLEKEWTEKGLALDLDLQDVFYYGNEEMLRQVWINIISNAVKFTGNGGTIHVSCQRRPGDPAAGTPPFAIVIVSDTGIGMDETTLARIFEKFYQGQTSHASEGNGLGLPMAKRIVALCRGNITVDSQPDQGTTFTIRLPLPPATESSLPRR